MNFIIVTKLLYSIYDTIFNLLFTPSQVKKKLLGLISTYFTILKTNWRRMLYLHYLVLLKYVSHLAKL